ncbi:DUF4397 domain-containing protein [Pedobacter nyackensis]|uniref:DUF4397 domain-containing protein n=1 Tax=Pedobacter nyackensis TaxID=475255 RepID=A0A1W2CXN9_9SPHI|nr:DUF4397 domain-containing protein [Pedobacter nyackensis]SMC89991.1 protein of unknown function [Pedobacter nyackensis]
MILKKYIQQSPIFIGVLMLLTLAGCKKEKQDFEYDNRLVTDARKSSSLRIVTLGDFNQVVMNDDTLTSYKFRLPADPITMTLPGTRYFPESGRLGATWSIPQSLLKNGKAKFFTETVDYNINADKLTIDLEENASQAMDYYLLPTERFAASVPKFVKIPRAVAAPSDPTKFKVRILNLSAKIENNDMEDLVGAMSLTWADGTPVSDKTNNVLPGQYSDYIELSYTTAQLRVLTPAGIQVPGVTKNLIFPATSTLTAPRGWPPEDTNLTFASFKSFAPGGIYTIIIAPYNFNIPYLIGNPGEAVTAYQNASRIMSDISEPLNVTYARVQAINTLPGMDGVKITMNGEALGAALAYTAHTSYQNYIIGSYTIEAKDASGKVLASSQLKLDANTNFTLWLHPDANGKASISAVANDLSRVVPGNTAGDDATYDRIKLDLPFSIRFLNLCPDVPYLTFTKDNGQSFNNNFNRNPAAVNNLRPAVFPIEVPYIQLDKDDVAYKIMAFRSSPGVIPGSWASDIPVLTGKDLIARPDLYVRGGLPNHEPGVYTIALVGSTKASAPAGQKAKMIILKHTK